jgi:hypothetical protein
MLIPGLHNFCLATFRGHHGEESEEGEEDGEENSQEENCKEEVTASATNESSHPIGNLTR